MRQEVVDDHTTPSGCVSTSSHYLFPTREYTIFFQQISSTCIARCVTSSLHIIDRDVLLSLVLSHAQSANPIHHLKSHPRNPVSPYSPELPSAHTQIYLPTLSSLADPQIPYIKLSYCTHFSPQRTDSHDLRTRMHGDHLGHT
jgi:hypothetical protein